MSYFENMKKGEQLIALLFDTFSVKYSDMSRSLLRVCHRRIANGITEALPDTAKELMPENLSLL